MPDNELSPEEIKALKRLAKYDVVSGKMVPKLSVKRFVFFLIFAIILLIIMFVLESIPVSELMSYKLF
jgi:hypothetical protein